MALLACMASCKNKGGEASRETTTVTRATGDTLVVRELDSLLLVAGDLVGRRVGTRGTVTHTCVHSGKRCFIVGERGSSSFRVEASGEIGGFNRELVGSTIEVRGILRERRLTAEFLDRHEEEVNEQKAKEDGSAESCAAELENIQQMRDWMKARGRDYYSVYYMDGEQYDVIEEEE